MADMNLVVVSGRVGTDPEYKDVGDTELASFRFAVNRYAGKGKEPEAMWFTVQCWGGRAAVCEYIKKGDALTVQGRLNLNEWEDDDEQKHVEIRIDADQVILPARSGDDDGEEKPRRSSGGGKKSGGKKGGHGKRGKVSKAPAGGKDSSEKYPF